MRAVLLAILSTLLFALPAPARSLANGARSASTPRCDTQWLLKPQNGTPDDDAIYVHAAPAADTTVRLVVNGVGYADVQRGWGFTDTTGARCTSGATCRFTNALGTALESGTDAGLPEDGWSEPEAWAAGAAAGVAVEAGRHVVFRATGLTPNTDYDWKLECVDANGQFGPAWMGMGHSKTLPSPGQDAAFKALITSDFHFAPTMFGALSTSTTNTDTPAGGLCLQLDIDPTNGITGTAYTPYTACTTDADCAGLAVATCSCSTADAIPDTVEDCDVNGVPDYLENIKQTNALIRTAAAQAGEEGYHVLFDAGDFANRHAGPGNTCLAADNAVGPCVTMPTSIAAFAASTFGDQYDLELQPAICVGGASAGAACNDDANCGAGVCSNGTNFKAQLGVPLGQGVVEGPDLGFKGTAEFADDELLLSNNRVAHALNRVAPITRQIPLVWKMGNHESGPLYGTDECGPGATGHCRPPYASGSAECNREDYDGASPRIDPTCGGLSERSVSVSNTERGHNFNQVYPNDASLNHPTLAVYDQSSYKGFMVAGHACVVMLDEYVYSDGGDQNGAIFAVDGTFDPANCLSAGFPFPACTGAGTGETDKLVQHPFAWNLGPQVEWLRDTVIPACEAAGAKTLVRLSHHQAGGFGVDVGGGDYGRGACPMVERHCLDGPGGNELVGPNVRAPGVANGEAIPCWGGTTTGQAEGLTAWCDYVNDGTNDNDGYCEAVDWNQPVDQRSDEGLVWQTIEDAIDAEQLDRAIHLIGHDHSFFVCPLNQERQLYVQLPQAGGGAVGWLNAPLHESFKDMDFNGVADYFESDLYSTLRLLGFTFKGMGETGGATNGADPITGYDGKGYLDLEVSASGNSATLRMYKVEAEDACYGQNNPNCTERSGDGTLIWTKTVGSE